MRRGWGVLLMMGLWLGGCGGDGGPGIVPLTREETVARLKALGIQEPVDEKGQIVLSGAGLSGLNLRRADLRDVYLDETALYQAYYSNETRWPSGFNPKYYGAILLN